MSGGAPGEGLLLAEAWGARVENGGLVLRPRLPDGVQLLEASGVRVHRTLLDLSIRQRPGRVVVRIAKRFGPDLGIDLAWAGPEQAVSLLLDEHALGGPTARFLASHEHEAQFLLAEGGGS